MPSKIKKFDSLHSAISKVRRLDSPVAVTETRLADIMFYIFFRLNENSISIWNADYFVLHMKSRCCICINGQNAFVKRNNEQWTNWGPENAPRMIHELSILFHCIELFYEPTREKKLLRLRMPFNVLTAEKMSARNARVFHVFSII